MNLGWVDFSKADRDRVLDVMNLLKQQGAVDEIGIGVIRDKFSNYFFPGTSTVQTTAKYFLIVPYVLKEACSGAYGWNLRQVLQTVDEKEKECGTILLKNCPNNEGIIGSRVLPEKWVARRPSSIYWNGICSYGICSFGNSSFGNSSRRLSIQELLRNALLHNKINKNEAALGNRSDSAEGDDRDAGSDYSAQIFSVPDDYYGNWRENLSVDLTNSEAEFLREKIETNVHESLLSYILKNNIDVDRYDSFEAIYEDLKDKLPPALEENMRIACEFNRLVYSARVRYNCILSKGKNQQAAEEWKHIAENAPYMLKVDIDSLLSRLHIMDRYLRIFLNDFKASVLSGDLEAADSALIRQEKRLKGPSRAKLLRPEDFPDDIWIGGRYLDYRFFNARRIINDIYRGEGRNV